MAFFFLPFGGFCGFSCAAKAREKNGFSGAESQRFLRSEGSVAGERVGELVGVRFEMASSRSQVIY
jgi:hypothetical protein